jgi:hypothetical protein
VVIQEKVIRDLRKAGKHVLSVAEPDIDAEDGQRKLVRVIMGGIAEYKAWLIRERLRAGGR